MNNSKIKYNVSDVASPILKDLCKIVHEYTGLEFFIVFPKQDGWASVSPCKKPESAEFCKLIQSSKRGAKQCRMCHILMSVAACNHNISEQHCHAGTKILAAPIDTHGHGSMAILSTCIYAPSDRSSEWNGIMKNVSNYGVDIDALEEAYNKLPNPTPKELALAESIINVAAKVAEEMNSRRILEEELAELKNRKHGSSEIHTTVENELKTALLSEQPGRTASAPKGDRSKTHTLIEVVADLITSKPAMPYSVGEIAAAARMTPNHFSTLFHKHKKQSFSDFLTEKRIEMAKGQLKDLTLHISEVALAVGYDDPGYFARRFKQKTGLTPREWRNKLTQ